MITRQIRTKDINAHERFIWKTLVAFICVLLFAQTQLAQKYNCKERTRFTSLLLTLNLFLKATISRIFMFK